MNISVACGIEGAHHHLVAIGVTTEDAEGVVMAGLANTGHLCGELCLAHMLVCIR